MASKTVVENEMSKSSVDGGKKRTYADKVRSKRQMYGPGCCAHSRKVPHPPRLIKNNERVYWWQDEDHVAALGLSA